MQVIQCLILCGKSIMCKNVLKCPRNGLEYIVVCHPMWGCILPYILSYVAMKNAGNCLKRIFIYVKCYVTLCEVSSHPNLTIP